MATTSRKFLDEFSHSTGMVLKTAERYAAVLRETGLFPTPRPGRGHLETRVKPADIANFSLAIAAPSFADVGETVSRLRKIRFAGAGSPYFHEAVDFGEVVEELIEARSRDNAPPEGTVNPDGLFVPSLIAFGCAR